METTTVQPPKYSCFSLQIDGAVAHMRMIRSRQHNSMTAEFWNELPLVIDEIEANPAVRAAVLSAQGDSFSSGMDRAIFEDTENLKNATAEERARLQRLILHYQSILNRINNCRVPIIAAIQGPCLGAAVDMVCRCDIRYATNSASFSIYEINLAIMADLGTLQYLPRLIGESAVREWALTGDRFRAQRAFDLGFCSALLPSSCEVMVHALEQAKKIAAHSPKAVAGTRWAHTSGRDSSIEMALAQTRTWQGSMFDADEVVEAMNALKERRSPIFADFASENIGL